MNLNAKHILHYPPASRDPVVCHCLFPCELSSVVRFQWHQGEEIVTPRGSGLGSPKVLNLFLQLAVVKYLGI